jgi:hypothetical protein
VRNYYKGEYQVVNKEKYIGNKNPIFRSSWESRFCFFADNSKSILKWGYESLEITYLSPIDNKVHRYFPDFYIELLDKNNQIKKYIVEVKPLNQTKKPEPPKNKNQKAQKRYLTEVATYVINISKWKSAEQYCNKKGFIFKLITENDIFFNGA